MKQPKQNDRTNVASIGNAFTLKQERQQANNQANERVNSWVHLVHRRRMLIILSSFAAIILVFGYQFVQAYRSQAALTEQVKTSRVKLKKAKATQADLQIQAKQLQNDDYLAKYIREKYYYSKPGEIIYSLPKDKAPTLFGDTDNK